MSRRKNTATLEDKAYAIEQLRRMCPPGTTIYCILRQVSRSGMQRRIDLFVKDGDDLQWLSGYCRTAFGWRIDDRKDGIVIGGCGMDMGFALVNNLSGELYRGGFGCIGKEEDRVWYCPSNDHNNGDRDYTPHSFQYTLEECPGKPCGSGCDHRSGPGGKEHWHKSGGYALKHQWL